MRSATFPCEPDAPLRPATRTYAALGDSFTSGVDELGVAGIAPMIARRLGTRAHVFAAHGAMTADVERRQLPAAITSRPDVVSVVCGGNDALLPLMPDVDGQRLSFERIIATLRRELPAAALITATTPDPSRFADVRPRTRARIARAIKAINESTREIAAAHGIACIDLARTDEAADRSNYVTDGVHADAVALERTSAEFARVLSERFAIECDTSYEELNR